MEVGTSLHGKIKKPLPVFRNRGARLRFTLMVWTVSLMLFQLLPLINNWLLDLARVTEVFVIVKHYQILCGSVGYTYHSVTLVIILWSSASVANVT